MPPDQTAEPLQFDSWMPPAEAGKGKATLQDWYDAWNQVRGGS